MRRALNTPRLLALGLALLGCRTTSVDDPHESGGAATEASETGDDAGPATGVSETTTVSFVPEDGDIPSRCDLWEQDCPEGEKCVPYASSGQNWDELECVPITGAQPPGQPCVYGGVFEATDDCDATSVCWATEEVDGQLVGECVAQCAGTPDVPVCPPMTECMVPGSGVPALCLPVCDPLVQDCGAEQGCYWIGSRFTCEPTAIWAEPGQPCDLLNDCVPGSLCASAEFLPDCAGDSCCTPFCPLGGGQDPCAVVPGTTCVPFFDFAPPDHEDLGVCVLR